MLGIWLGDQDKRGQWVRRKKEDIWYCPSQYPSEVFHGQVDKSLNLLSSQAKPQSHPLGPHSALFSPQLDTCYGVCIPKLSPRAEAAVSPLCLT